jgi:FtsP/CotA-like multicopper oxidase with cupredoxin domain
VANITCTSILLAAIALALPATAFAQGDICPRPAVGDPAKSPPDLYSDNGVLQVALNYYSTTDGHNRTRDCFKTADGKLSPTLHVLPGDTLDIALTNMASKSAAVSRPAETADDTKYCGSKTLTLDSVNLHFDGVTTSPKCHSDDVFMSVNSGKTFQYNVKIPANEPPGLYWYHPTVHGLQVAAVSGGASGAIVVDGIDRLQPAVKHLLKRLLVLRDLPLEHAPKMNTGNPNVPTADLSLNYVPILYPRYTPSVIAMHAGAQEFWRVVNASANTQADLQVVYDGVAQPLQIAGLDGVPTGSDDGRHKGTIVTQTDIFLPAGGRAEFIVQAPSTSVKVAQLITLGVVSGPDGMSDPRRALADIHTTTDPHWLPPSPERFATAANDSTGEPSFDGVPLQRTLNLTEAVIRNRHAPAGGAEYFITVEGQSPCLSGNCPPGVVTHKGAVEDWTIVNQTHEVHEFHINQVHYLLLEVNGKPIPKDQRQFYDTHQVDYWTGTGPYPSIKVRLDFRGPVAGEFLYHCHILDHADAGMFGKIVVTKGPPVIGAN